MLRAFGLALASASLTSLLLVAPAAPAWAQDDDLAEDDEDQDDDEPEKDKPGKDSKVRYAVVAVDDRLEVVPEKELKEFKKKLGEAYKQAVKDHAAAKKEASKAKEPFTEAKPKKPKLKLMAKGLKTEADAKGVIEKILEERRKAEEAKNKKK